MSGEVGLLAGDRVVSHERSRPADLPRRPDLRPRYAGSNTSHYCGGFYCCALLAHGRRYRNAVTARNVYLIDALERGHRRKDCSSFCQLGPPANTVEQCGPEPRLKLMNGRACSGTQGRDRRLMLTSARPHRSVRGRRQRLGRTRPNMWTPSPTTRFCSTSWLIGRRARRSEIASWSTIPLRPMGSIEARSRADISSTVRGLEAADRLRKKRLRQPKHRPREKDREGDRDEEDHVDRQ